MAKLTIIDVARLAGVSTATVSRAMHTPHALRPATLARVQEVMKEHGYIYNATAGDFSRRKSTVIGLLVISNTTKIATTVKAIQQVATEQGFPLIVCTCGFDPELERKHLQQFLERGVAGVVVIGHMKENVHVLESLQQRGIPLVFLWESLPETNFSYIGIDNEKACFTMTSHLIKLGHKRIAFMCGFKAGVSRLEKRYNGYKRALVEHGLPFEPELVLSLTSNLSNGKNGMLQLLELPNPPRCVFCASDVLAMGALAALYQKGLSAPEDMTVVGFDNSDIAEYTCPPLTSVHIPGVEMGQLGIQALMTLIRNPHHSPIQKVLPTSITIRASHSPI